MVDDAPAARPRATAARPRPPAPRSAWRYPAVPLLVLIGLGGLLSAVLAVGGGHAQPGFLGTNASRSADLNLVLHLLMVVALLIGAYLGHVHDIQVHRINQTTVVLVNLVLIASVMLVSFGRVVVPSLSTPGDPPITVAIVHGLLGLLAEGMGIYVLLRMNGLIPQRWRFQNFKLLMRATLAQWLVVTSLGVGLYWLWYAPVPIGETPSPAQPAVAPAAATQPAAAQPAAAGVPTPPSGPAQPVGSVTFQDDRGRSDQVRISADGLAPPPDGTVFAAWLSSGGQPSLRLGRLPLSAENSVRLAAGAPDNRNLVAAFDGFAVTDEPAAGAAGPPGEVRYRADLPLKTVPFIRRMLADLPGAPANTPAAVGVLEQAEALRLHVELARTAARANDVAGVQRHAEHLVNLVEGDGGPNFGDRNADGRVQNPGDGFGLLDAPGRAGYLTALAEAAAGAAASDDATETVKVHAGHVRVAVDNARRAATALRDLALEAAKPGTTTRSMQLAEQLAPLAEALATGVDANANGQIEPVAGEGGARVAYLHAQFMAAMPLLPAGRPVAPALPPILPAQPSAAELSAAPTPLPTLAAAPAPPGGPLALDIANFQFGSTGAAVKLGATITWTNRDRARHTVTADDRQFDSGNLAAGQTFSATPRQPGAIPYYCELHGSPGGQGMSGVLTVVP